MPNAADSVPSAAPNVNNLCIVCADFQNFPDTAISRASLICSNPIAMNDVKVDVLPDDALFRIERRIAQRADELSQERGPDRQHNLDHWLQAEREVWATVDVVSESAPRRNLAVV